MEDNNHSLISINASLTKIEKQIAIGEKLLGLNIGNSEREKVKKFLIENMDNDDFPISLISRYYKIKNSILERYKNLWDWDELSNNDHLDWSVDLIETYKENWSWIPLLNNSYALTEEIFKQFEDRWDFKWLEFTNNFPPSIELYILKKHEFKWDWQKLSCNETNWTVESLREFEDKWDWSRLSSSEFILWSIELLKEFENKWDWESLSYNENVCWSPELINKFKEKWDWYYLSGLQSLPWSIELIEKFEEKWEWNSLSQNSNLPWSNDLIEKFENKWQWKYLSGNKKLPWSKNLIEKFKSKKTNINESDILMIKDIDLEIKFIEINKSGINWNSYSYHHCLKYTELPWSEKIISKYQDSLDWKILSLNESLPWSDKIIELYKDKWNWDFLSLNESLSWSFKFISKNQDYFKWYSLHTNKKVAELVVPFLDDKMITEILKLYETMNIEQFEKLRQKLEELKTQNSQLEKTTKQVDRNQLEREIGFKTNLLIENFKLINYDFHISDQCHDTPFFIHNVENILSRIKKKLPNKDLD